MSYVEQYPMWIESDEVPDWVAGGAAPSYSVVMEVFHDELEVGDRQRTADLGVLESRIVTNTPADAVHTRLLGTRRIGIRMFINDMPWMMAIATAAQALEIVRGWRAEAQIARVEIMAAKIEYSEEGAT